MSRLRSACRVYSAIVFATASFAVAVVAAYMVGPFWWHVLGVHEDVILRGRVIAILSNLLSFVTGCLMCIGCFCLKLEPPVRLTYCTLLALVVFAVNFWF